MEVAVFTLREVQQVITTSRQLVAVASRKLGHDAESCACDICCTKRLLAESIQRIGSLDLPTLERAWW